MRGLLSAVGHVRVRDSSSQLGSDIDGEAGNNYSGWSVALSSDGTWANYNGDNGASSGHVRVYQWSSGSWTQLGADIDGEAAGDQSGSSVALSSNGTILAVGAMANGTGWNAGHVRVYEWSGGSWVQLGVTLTARRLATTVAQRGRAQRGRDDPRRRGAQERRHRFQCGSRALPILQRSDQIGDDIDGEAADDQSFSVALSGHGTLPSIGAPFNDGTPAMRAHVVRAYDLIVDGGPATYHGCTTVGSKSRASPGAPRPPRTTPTASSGSASSTAAPSPSACTARRRPLGQTLVGAAAGDRFGYAVSGTTEWRHRARESRATTRPGASATRRRRRARRRGPRAHAFQYNPHLLPAVPPAALERRRRARGQRARRRDGALPRVGARAAPRQGVGLPRARARRRARDVAARSSRTRAFEALRWAADAHTDFVWTATARRSTCAGRALASVTYDAFLSYDAARHRYIADATSPDAAALFGHASRGARRARRPTTALDLVAQPSLKIQDGLNGGVARQGVERAPRRRKRRAPSAGRSVNAALELQDAALYDEPFRKGGWVEFKQYQHAATDFPTGEGRGHSISLSDDGIHMAYGVHQADHAARTDAGVVRLHHSANPHGYKSRVARLRLVRQLSGVDRLRRRRGRAQRPRDAAQRQRRPHGGGRAGARPEPRLRHRVGAR